MGFLDRFRAVAEIATSEVPASPAFSTIGPDQIDPALFGLASWGQYQAPESRVTRREAIQVPAIKRGRDLICGTLGALPLRVLDPGNHETTLPGDLVGQPEVGRARSVTMTRTIEDLLFEAKAYWLIRDFNWAGYPSSVTRIEVGNVDEQDGKVWVSLGNETIEVPATRLIKFESPNDPMLDAGARAIRTALSLDLAARNYANEPAPSMYFTPAEGSDPADDDDVADLLDAWGASRRTRATAYVPAAVKLNTMGYSPLDLQLSDQRQHAVLEIARLMGIDPEDLGVSTTSRTYQNAESRRQDLINQTLMAYVAAVQDRLSMPDVTPRGYTVRFNFDAFLLSDMATRFEAYVNGLETGAITHDEMRQLEGRPATAPPEVTPMPTPAPVEAQATAREVTFEVPDVTAMDSDTGTVFEANHERRTITGLAVPYGKPARSGGRMWQFSKGSLEWSDPKRVKLLIQHDFSQAVGHAVTLEETDAGLIATFKVARGEAGDRALTMAEDGVWDGLSIGMGIGGQYTERSGVHFATSAPLAEISLTPSPAFEDARLIAVTATADQEGNTMGDDKPEVIVAGTAPTFDAKPITDAIAAGFANLPSFPPREVVPISDGGVTFTAVNEAVCYRFDGGRGKYDFSTDLVNSLRNHDGEAGQRIAAFMAEMGPRFNVTQANVATTNPNRNRPDLYVDQQDFEFPLYQAIYKGTISDNTPFVLPKFGSSSGLVADHVEGVEPSGGAFTTTAQTVTPSPLSGKAVINREVWDQGGNPQVSQLIWRQMVRGWFEGLEASIQAFLVANAASIADITVTTAAADAALEASLTSQLVPLQYLRGGFRMRDFFLQVDLYKALVAAKDTSGKRLFPAVAFNPTNVNGAVEPYWAAININGIMGRPAWATAATSINAGSSWLLDRNDMSLWTSAPQRITMDNIAVATVQLGIWGYKALAITDFTGLREVIYDPV